VGRIDATKIVDRDSESSLFRRMVTRELPRRVLLVSERSGNGKSDLLRKLELLSFRDYDVPAGRVELDEFQTLPDEFAVVQSLHDSLKDDGLTLPHFETLSYARGFKDTRQFVEKLRSVVGAVDLSGAEITGGAPTIAGIIYNINAETVHWPDWDGDAEEQARALCVEAFLADLTDHVAERPVALLFDGLDKVPERLRKWVITEFVRRRALADWERRKLVVVLAGSDVGPLVTERLSPAERELVEPLSRFEEWTPDLVAKFLEAQGIGAMKPEQFQAICLLIRSGSSLMEVLLHAQLISGRS